MTNLRAIQKSYYPPRFVRSAWYLLIRPTRFGGKSRVRVCNLNQRSQRSDFEALVQGCDELGVEHEGRTVTKPFAREDPQGSTTMMLGTGQELLKRSPDE
jgi:hypothetical protein